MARNKITIDFNAYNILKSKLDEIGGKATERAVESALKASHNAATKKLSAAIAPHKKTGRTERSLDERPVVKWTGTEASVEVGFHITDGGLASIFLMYGTKLHGQPHITPDRNLYNAIYGAQTKKEIQKIQEEAFTKVIERVMKT